MSYPLKNTTTISRFAPEVEPAKARTMLLETYLYIRDLYNEYGTDTTKMFRDVKLNYLQKTKDQLQRLLDHYLKEKTLEDIKEQVDDIDNFEGKTNVDKELDGLEDELKELGLDEISSDEDIEKKIIDELGIDENVSDVSSLEEDGQGWYYFKTDADYPGNNKMEEEENEEEKEVKENHTEHVKKEEQKDEKKSNSYRVEKQLKNVERKKAIREKKVQGKSDSKKPMTKEMKEDAKKKKRIKKIKTF
ncbi:hypothetical protein EIN_399700 [Entamoeba invadens IP1]|uniref:Uncharacterized protein n=1 Tax=Entamoeba invadens IP1 TaxID=370355 RepID=A0A0A1UAB9_ENTIV|nr:hypothetical protein EIN_399700 [Entamoeba invadens IP1]ELP91930.1 hypothetical protein EIN_399700 [Entamoeba invadens IP1]|eukprot:XP_004258701.1 hypothetical protein EIN_399700 [Entamoeba invadens IP1]